MPHDVTPHERLAVVRRLMERLGSAIAVTGEETPAAQITPGELMQAISDLLATYAKYLIRAERHPGASEQPGDMACDGDPPCEAFRHGRFLARRKRKPRSNQT